MVITMMVVICYLYRCAASLYVSVSTLVRDQLGLFMVNHTSNPLTVPEDTVLCIYGGERITDAEADRREKVCM